MRAQLPFMETCEGYLAKIESTKNPGERARE